MLDNRFLSAKTINGDDFLLFKGMHSKDNTPRKDFVFASVSSSTLGEKASLFERLDIPVHSSKVQIIAFTPHDG